MGSILIVDDNAEIRETLRILLSGLGEISEASNGKEALLRIETQKPKLILLDIAMPEISGIAVLQAALKADPSVIVLMLTGEYDIEIAKSALEIGARAYITKPFDGPKLRGEIAKIMGIDGATGNADSYRPWRVA